MGKGKWRRWGPTIAATLVLQACGGGGGGSSGHGEATPSGTAQAQGVVYDADTGQPLAQATLQIGGQTASTDSQGQFELSTSANQTVGVHASLEGYADGLARMTLDSKGGHITINLTRIGTSPSLDIATGGTVTLAGSPAQVTLPGAALIDAATGKPVVTGTVKVALTVLDARAQPGSLPGSYKADGGGLIESFGAIQVQLSDAATGQALQLAADKAATVSIPLNTRSADTPASVPLSWLDSRTGAWVQAGTASRRGSAETGYFYEGTVTHLGALSVDRSVNDTVSVKGCVRDAENKVPNGPVTVTAEGLSYSAQTQASMAADGSFVVPLKRNERARLAASAFKLDSAAVLLAPSTADIDLRNQCLVLTPPPAQPVIVQQPMSLTAVAEGMPALLAVNARGPGPLRYQWLRDGAALPGQTTPMLALPPLSMEDDGARFSVVVRNGADSSVQSDALTLAVTPLETTRQLQALQDLSWGVALTLPGSISAATVVNIFTSSILAPTDVCRTGTVSEITLDGIRSKGGEKVPLEEDHEHVLSATFSSCVSNFAAIKELTDPFTGTASSRYYIGADNAWINRAELALSDDARKLRIVGQYDGSLRLTGLVVTPAAGATLTHTTLNGDNTLTFTGGQIAARTVPGGARGTVNYENVRFTLHGVSYLLTGQFSLPERQASDDVNLLTEDGQSIAHLRYDAVKKLLFLEATGTVPRF